MSGPRKVEQGQEWHLRLQLVLGDWHKCNIVFGRADETDCIISGASSDAVHEDNVCHICICSLRLLVESSSQEMGARVGVLFYIVSHDAC